MLIGVVYKFKPQNKINGTLFYCYEHYRMLQKYADVRFYIVGITPGDLDIVTKIFSQKYQTEISGIVPITPTQLYQLKLDRTLVLDVDTFRQCREFFTNEIHCFANELHDMVRYRNDRQVTYYGSYPYQPHDVFCYLKLNFDIFPALRSTQPGVFISCLDPKFIRLEYERFKRQFQRPIILKKQHSGDGNLFELIDAVHYVHVVRDTNNRIIPEGFFYGKSVTVEEVHPYEDSIQWRYQDIMQNGLENYTLTDQDPMIKAMLE